MQHILSCVTCCHKHLHVPNRFVLSLEPLFVCFFLSMMIQVGHGNISVSKINFALVFVLAASFIRVKLKASRNNRTCADDVRQTTAAEALDEK